MAAAFADCANMGVVPCQHPDGRDRMVPATKFGSANLSGKKRHSARAERRSPNEGAKITWEANIGVGSAVFVGAFDARGETLLKSRYGCSELVYSPCMSATASAAQLLSSGAFSLLVTVPQGGAHHSEAMAAKSIFGAEKV